MNRLPFKSLILILICGGIVGCATLPEDYPRSPSRAFADTHDTTLARRMGDKLQAHPGKTGVVLLESGADAFVARAALSIAAEKSIDAQYYLYHDDKTARLLTYQLLKAADRGVRVRLLVDDMDLGGRDLSAASLDAHENIEVRLFNPFIRGTPRLLQFATRFGDITRRMHNKSFTVDNQVSVVGGRNIGDEYFQAGKRFNFTDLDAMIIGRGVSDVSGSFDLYWNHELAYPVSALVTTSIANKDIERLYQRLELHTRQLHQDPYIVALRTSKLANEIKAGSISFDWGVAHLVYDQPDKLIEGRDEHHYRLISDLAKEFKSVTDQLIIISAYFVPGPLGTQFLEDLRKRGIRVRIITNSLASTDVAVVHAGYAKYRRRLLKARVELFEAIPDSNTNRSNSTLSGSSAASLHSKSFVFDNDRVFIGSFNLDPRSAVENTEMGLIIESKAVAGKVVDWFESFTMNNAYRLELAASNTGGEKITWYEPDGSGSLIWSHEPEVSWWKRLAVLSLRVLPLDSQL